MKKSIQTLTLCFVFFTACATQDRNIKAKIIDLPHKQFSNYTNNLNKSVIDRIDVAPDFFMKYLIEIDNIPEYKAYSLNKQEKDLFEEYYNFLPEKFKQIMNRKLIAVYFIEHFLGGGFTDYVLDENEQIYVVLVFNPKILSETLGDWIKFRDNSFFKSDGNIIASNELGNDYKGLLHTLVHETGHIYDYINSITPYTEPDLQYFGYNKKIALFTDNYWIDYYNPEPKYDFKYRADLKPYGLGKAIDPGKQRAMYVALSKTPFVSLYGAMTWAEDFVETFAWFYLEEKLNIRYNVRLIREGKVELTFEPLKNKIARQRYNQIKKEIESK
jgi:hypothetical protein